MRQEFDQVAVHQQLDYCIVARKIWQGVKSGMSVSVETAKRLAIFPAILVFFLCTRNTSRWNKSWILTQNVHNIFAKRLKWKQFLFPLPLVDEELWLGQDTQTLLLAAAKGGDVQSRIAAQRQLLEFWGSGHIPHMGLRYWIVYWARMQRYASQVY